MRPFSLYWFLLCAVLIFFVRAVWAWHTGVVLPDALLSGLYATVGVGLLILLGELVVRLIIRLKAR